MWLSGDLRMASTEAQRQERAWRGKGELRQDLQGAVALRGEAQWDMSTGSYPQGRGVPRWVRGF